MADPSNADQVQVPRNASPESDPASEPVTMVEVDTKAAPSNESEEKAIEVVGATESEEKAIEVAEPVAPTQELDPAHWKMNLGLLVLAFILGYTVQFMHFAGTVALAREMAGASISTIPNALIFVGALISTMPISIMGEKKGLKVSYLVGTLFGLTGGTLCIVAVLTVGCFVLVALTSPL